LEPVLALKDVGYHYGTFWALKGIDLNIHRGEILGILGPNGSGKSTLLKIMDGLLAPQKGKVFLSGHPMNAMGRSQVAREVAMVAQENYFSFSFSALEVVLMGRFPHLRRLQFEGEKDLAVAAKALKTTHAEGLAERSIHTLSGGEKQRVLLARALTQEAKIILLDEPTSFLDLKYKRETFHLISSLTRDQHLSFVVVSHDIDLAAQYCHRIVMIKEGVIHNTGAPDQVITASIIEDVYGCPVVVDKNPVTGTPRVNMT
jgi:iron complex transport system ATP-binding protein